MIILTDGEWNTGGDPTPISKRMQLNGTKVFTIAVGEAATTKVQALASLPLSKYYYNVKNKQFLPNILHKMILNMCHRDDDAVDAERAAAELLTSFKAMVPAPATIMRQQQRRRLDWSNLTATSTLDCGNDDASRWVVVRNGALNPLRIRTCNVDYNHQVCKGTPTKNETGYVECSPSGSNNLAFIPPNTTVTMRLPMNVTYVVALYCVNKPGKSIHCLTSPTPLEFYGPNPEGGGFPVNGLIIPKESQVFCAVDVDCEVGETCDVSTHTCG